MTTAVLELAGAGQGCFHWWCCRDDVALCGADLTDVPVTDQENPMCPACEVVLRAKTPCPVPNCGGVA